MGPKYLTDRKKHEDIAGEIEKQRKYLEGGLERKKIHSHTFQLTDCVKLRTTIPKTAYCLS